LLYAMMWTLAQLSIISETSIFLASTVVLLCNYECKFSLSTATFVRGVPCLILLDHNDLKHKFNITNWLSIIVVYTK
jgi:hypothetical protein